MKKIIFILIATLLFGFITTACKKDKDEVSSNKLFISCKIDGESYNVEGTTNQIWTGNGGYTSAGFFNLDDDVNIEFTIYNDSISFTELNNLLNQKLPVPSCYGVSSCGNGGDLYIEYNGDSYSTYSVNNILPTNYFRITSVKFHNEITTVWGDSYKQYLVEGDFNVNISTSNNNSNVKEVTNGQFRLIFQEYKD